jgi:hypothetical protein
VASEFAGGAGPGAHGATCLSAVVRAASCVTCVERSLPST